MPRARRSVAVTIREARPADAERMLEHVEDLASERHVDVPLQPGDFTVTVEEERRILADYARCENGAFFTAWDGRKLKGMLNLKPSDLLPGRHRAMLGMSVQRSVRGCGVGRALLEHAVAWARQTRLLTRLELDVYERNAPAMHLYESVGFLPEGRRRQAIWEGDNAVDTYMMGLCFEEKAPVPYDLMPPEAPLVDDTDVRDDTPVVIRDAEPDDAPAVMALWRSIRSDPTLLVPTAGLACVERTEAFRKRFLGTLAGENSYSLVAGSGDQLVGTISARGHDRRRMCREALVAIGIRAGWRGRGIGRRLLETLERRARVGGILRRLTLFVYAENAPAIGLYERCGYAVEGRARHSWFQHGRYHDELLMARLLD